jgi:hypothetical protein
VGVELGHRGLVEHTLQVVGDQLDQLIAPAVPTRPPSGLHAVHDARQVPVSISTVPGRSPIAFHEAITSRAGRRCNSGGGWRSPRQLVDDGPGGCRGDTGARSVAPNETWKRAHQTTTLW